MRTKAEIERSLAEMKRMADDARRGLAKAKEMNATVLVKHFEQWETKCEARAQILSWVLGEQELNEDVQPQLPQTDVSRRFSDEDVINIIKAWESLPGDRSYTPREISNWLQRKMSPAINRLRAVLNGG